MAQEKTDWVTPTAIALGVAGAGAGLYLLWKKPPKEVKEGDWAEASTILSRKTFSVQVKPIQPGDWLPAYTELQRKSFSVQITGPVPGVWLPADTELGRSYFWVNIVPSTGPFIIDLVSDPWYAGWITTDPVEPVYSKGDVVIIEAHTIWPFIFDHWDVDGIFEITMNPMIQVVTGDHVVTAYFRL